MRQFPRAAIELALLPLSLALLATSVLAQPSSDLPRPFVYLSEIAPDIQQDMRYASTNNFLGRRVEGYLAPECILTKKTALALQRVQEALELKGYSLKVYDCYRPERAVGDFVRWSQQESDTRTKQQYYPDLDKRNLFKLGYIATRSMHSRGNTVDLTIVPKGTEVPQFREQDRIARCDAPKGKRAPDNSLDFGTAFDCFDPKSHTGSTEISAAAQRNRRLLVEAMEAVGFQNYSKEWWHFELKGAAMPEPFNFPIRKRPDQPTRDPDQPTKDGETTTALVVPAPDGKTKITLLKYPPPRSDVAVAIVDFEPNNVDACMCSMQGGPRSEKQEWCEFNYMTSPERDFRKVWAPFSAFENLKIGRLPVCTRAQR